MAERGQRMRVLEQSSVAIDLSRSEFGETIMRVGHPDRDMREWHLHLNPAEARVLAYSLLAAAARGTAEVSRNDDAEWPEQYWPEGPNAA